MEKQELKLPEGVLLLDKPSGWTSHKAVMVVRKLLHMKIVGHAGTLDPAATGLLVILVGKATKIQSELQCCDKIYEGVISFGKETDTWDGDGTMVREAPCPEISAEEMRKSIGAMTGRVILQVPPYSAVKFHGSPLYKLARLKKTIPLISRQADIYSWPRAEWKKPELHFKLECAGGTYVRSIAQELGKKWNCGAYLKSLRRLKVGKWDVKDAIAGDLIHTLPVENLHSRLISIS